MPPLDTKALSSEVAGTLNRALTPVLERLATIEAKLPRVATAEAAIADLGQRVLVAETKAASFQPPHDKTDAAVRDAVTPLLERLATIDTRLGPLSDVRDRLVVVETKCCGMPSGPDASVEQRLLSAMERLSTLEYALSRAESHEAMIAELKARLAAAEATSAQYAELATTARQLIERVTTMEAKYAVMTVLMPSQPDAVVERVTALEAKSMDMMTGRAAVDGVSRRVDDLAKDVGAMRERVAVMEAKSDVPSIAEPLLNGLTSRVQTLEHRSIEDPAMKECSAMRERIAVVEMRASVPGPPGVNGKDGADGLGFDDLIAVQDDDRTLTVKASRGDRVKAIGTMRIPAQIQRGVWVEGKSYDRGDVVTWGGSQFHANDTTTAKPGEGSSDWTLVVKRGRDGKDGKDAAPQLPVVRVAG